MRNIRSVVMVSFFALMAASQARAQVAANHFKDANNSIWLSAGGSLLNYKERLPPTVLNDSERGTLPSLAAGLSVQSDRGFFLTVGGEYEMGDITYRGALLATPLVPYTSQTTETTYAINAQVGWTYPLASNMQFIPYIEAGYRNWERELSASQVETYSHYDVMGGVLLQYAPTAKTLLNVYAAAGQTQSPSMEYNNLTYDLGQNMIYKTGAKFTYAYGRKVDLFTTLDYQYFNYGRSQTQPDTSYEPPSFTSELTARVGIAYRFR